MILDTETAELIKRISITTRQPEDKYIFLLPIVELQLQLPFGSTLIIIISVPRVEICSSCSASKRKVFIFVIILFLKESCNIFKIMIIVFNIAIAILKVTFKITVSLIFLLFSIAFHRKVINDSR